MLKAFWKGMEVMEVFGYINNGQTAFIRLFDDRTGYVWTAEIIIVNVGVA